MAEYPELQPDGSVIIRDEAGNQIGTASYDPNTGTTSNTSYSPEYQQGQALDSYLTSLAQQQAYGQAQQAADNAYRQAVLSGQSEDRALRAAQHAAEMELQRARLDLDRLIQTGQLDLARERFGFDRERFEKEFALEQEKFGLDRRLKEAELHANPRNIFAAAYYAGGAPRYASEFGGASGMGMDRRTHQFNQLRAVLRDYGLGDIASMDDNALISAIQNNPNLAQNPTLGQYSNLWTTPTTEAAAPQVSPTTPSAPIVPPAVPPLAPATPKDSGSSGVTLVEPPPIPTGPGYPGQGGSYNPSYPMPELPSTPGGVWKLPRFATGGIVTKPTIGLLGEEGPEAVVPLENNSGGNMLSSAYNQSFAPGDDWRSRLPTTPDTIKTNQQQQPQLSPQAQPYSPQSPYRTPMDYIDFNTPAWVPPGYDPNLYNLPVFRRLRREGWSNEYNGRNPTGWMGSSDFPFNPQVPLHDPRNVQLSFWQTLSPFERSLVEAAYSTAGLSPDVMYEPVRQAQRAFGGGAGTRPTRYNI